MSYNISKSLKDHLLESVAIIGMAGRFPEAENVEEFWKNLCSGKESITFFNKDEIDRSIDPEIINNPNYVPARGIINDIRAFDAEFFKILPLEAECMDPQARIFLEIVWHTLEDSGYKPEDYLNKEGGIGLFAGSGVNNYYINNVLKHRKKVNLLGAFQTMLFNEKDFLTTRASYALNLKGPSVNVSTACSTSLVAVCQAVDSLLDYHCDLALAGGVSIPIPQKSGYLYQEGMILSPDGHCRAFDSKSNGTVMGSGVGVVALKRLEDAIADNDNIRAVIRGIGINNDGSDKMSFMAPSAKSQAAAISQAISAANVDSSTISYIEAHGTGTQIGDQIEVEGLKLAFGESKHKTCAIGSVKPSIGHLDSAAGIAGLIKTVLCLENKKLVPTVNFTRPNQNLKLDDSPFYVAKELTNWESDSFPRRAGVSSFGIGGTNAHVLLEEAPLFEGAKVQESSTLFVLSAKTRNALKNQIVEFGDFFHKNDFHDLKSVSFTLNQRKEFEYRKFFISSSLSNLSIQLKNCKSKFYKATNDRLVSFMFPGQGSQKINMGLSIYKNYRVFKSTLDQCADILTPLLKIDIRGILYPQKENEDLAKQKLNKTVYTQPALFVVSYALAQQLMSWGIYPESMTGHSIGEYVAATLANVFSLEDALKIVCKRGELMQSVDPGSMLSVLIDDDKIDELIAENIELSASNAPGYNVFSGPTIEIENLKDILKSKNIHYIELNTSHAFHSKMMDCIVEPFMQEVNSVRLNKPSIPFVSTESGTWISDEQATSPAYWARHLRNPVKFKKSVSTLWQNTDRILLEVGPGKTLSILARKQAKDVKQQISISSLENPVYENENESVLAAVGALWANGLKVDWEKINSHAETKRISLPKYKFDKKEYWLSSPIFSQNEQDTFEEETAVPNSNDNIQINGNESFLSAGEEILANIWKDILGIKDISKYDTFFELGGNSIHSVQVATKINQEFKIDLSPRDLLLNSLEQIAAKYLANIVPYPDNKSNLVSTPPEIKNSDYSFNHFYFGEHHELYGAYYKPKVLNNDVQAVVLCPPYGQEYMRAHWAFRKLAINLVRNRIPVLKFDYYGSGDSLGDSNALKIQRSISDIQVAIKKVMELSRAKRVSLIGLRMGGSLSLMVSQDEDKPDKIIMWDPVFIGEDYVKNLIHMDKIVTIPQKFREKRTNYVPILGFKYHPDQINELKKFNLFDVKTNNISTKIFLIGTEEDHLYNKFIKTCANKSLSIKYHYVEDNNGWNVAKEFDQALLVDDVLQKITKLILGNDE